MSTIEVNNYSIVASARGQEVLLYNEFGSYQGEWVCIGKDEENYYIYKGWYGSCSGCDDLQATFGWGEDSTEEKVNEFIEDYPHFIDIPWTTAKELARRGNVMKVFPANIRDDYSDIEYDDVANDLTLIIKIREGLDIDSEDIINCRNQEIKQQALKEYGYEKFLNDIGYTSIDKSSFGELIAAKDIDDILFVRVKDASTDREYLLRVPPQMKTAKQAVAWTFNMRVDEYKPLIQT